MKIIEVKTKGAIKQYLKFVNQVYQADPKYSDFNSLFLKNFLYKKDSYAKRAKVLPVMIEDPDIQLAGTFIFTKDSKQLKLSFLEFLPNSEVYIKAILEYGKRLLVKYQLDEMILGVNGQISYGLGILRPEYNQEFEFNANYNKSYYTEELDRVIPTKKRAFSYEYDPEHSLSMIDKKLVKQLGSEFQFRYLDLRHFKRDMLIFGELCDKTLRSTPYYAYKSPYEMYELMKQMSLLLRRQNIIFALKDGKEIGFIFVHPDYAELFDRPRFHYVPFFLRYLFQKPEKLIYNVIGVDPEYQKSGIAVGLIYHSIQTWKKKYSKGVSSFILEENIPSTALCRKLSIGINKEYRLYEVRRDPSNV